MKKYKVGDIVRLKRKMVFSYDHYDSKEKHTEIDTNTDMLIISVSPMNAECVTITRIGKNDNIGIFTRDLC
jgi:hypothetical protein